MGPDSAGPRRSDAMMRGMDVEKALAHWRSQGLLSREQAERLEASLEELQEERSSRGIVIFATVGAVLVGLGILLFIGGNWQGMGPLSRGIVLLAVYAGVVAGAMLAGRRGYERLGEALWFLATLSFGANVFFLAQIFNHTLTYWQGPLVWLLGVLAMGFARRRLVYGHAAVPLFLLFLGWLGGGAGWFMDDQMEFLFSDRGLRPLLPLLGVGLLSGVLLLGRWRHGIFLTRACRGWGLLLIAVPLLIATADAAVVEGLFSLDWTPKQAILAGFALVAIGLGLAVLGSTAGRIALGVALVLGGGPLITVGGDSWLGRAVQGNGFLFFLFVTTVFALALLTVWVGLQLARRALVNAGLATVAVLVFIQYFALSSDLLHGSLVFVFGGLLLMALAFGLERTRRRLLERMEEGPS